MPESQKDWHPGSNGQVLDIVHPSLYCLVNNRTLARKGDNLEYSPLDFSLSEDKTEAPAPYFSRRTAWLPSDFKVSDDGKSTTLVSPYINNLHPDNQGLYEVIEHILGKFIPMWERVLGSVSSRVFSNAPYVSEAAITGPSYERKPFVDKWYADVVRNSRRMPVPRCVFQETEPIYQKGYPLTMAGPFYREIPCYRPSLDGGPGVDREYEEFAGETREERRRAWLRTQEMHLPDSREKFDTETSLEEIFPIMDLKGANLQVIVKLANIHLTPEKPEYAGGSWHVEGGCIFRMRVRWK